MSVQKSPAVELDHVGKRFEGVEAVRDVSLQIEEGEFFSLLGASGCGKTTTLRMIAGFEQPTEGKLSLMGIDIKDKPPHKRNVNMVFQNYALFPHMTVFDNVAFGLEVRHIRRDEIQRRVHHALEMVRLTGLDRRKPAQISGGQQQRVALARALVTDPAVLLLDEPLGALDQKLRKEMQLELKRLQRDVGITFIYVTHDQEEALTMSDHIAVMNLGRVVQAASPRELYDHPSTRFVANFIGTSNLLEGRVRSIDGEKAMVEIPGAGPIYARTTDGVHSGDEVSIAIRPEQMRISFKPEPQEDNVVEGVLDDVIFVGNDIQYFIMVGNENRIMTRQQNRHMGDNLATPQPGDSVKVCWSSLSSSLLLE